MLISSRASVIALLPGLLLLLSGGAGAQVGDIARGEYIFKGTGGCGCHTDIAGGGAPLAGGRPLKTPFGVFYSSNITPDPIFGIGRWSGDDFIRAMTRGVAPDGSHYFPVFPYTSFAGMTRADLLDLKAYLFSRPPEARANRSHEVYPPFGWRWLLPVWKWLSLPYPRPTLEGPAADTPEVRRGAYLVGALGHCAECHTPRNLLGGLKAGLHLAGSEDGPEGELAPNITPDRETGIGAWSDEDIAWLLESGFLPDGDDVQGLMAEMIEHGFSQFTPEDSAAIIAYLRAIPPVENALKRP